MTRLCRSMVLLPNEEKDWNAAVDAYAARWSSFDLLDNNLELIDNRLAELENCADLSGKGPTECISGLQPPMIAALEAAAPIYRAQWWPQQDSENRAWIAAVAPPVRQMGEVIGNELTEIYITPWPQGILRVDRDVGYSGPQGAYTSVLPLHIVISSNDPRNQDLASFGVPAFARLPSRWPAKPTSTRPSLRNAPPASGYSHSARPLAGHALLHHRRTGSGAL